MTCKEIKSSLIVILDEISCFEEAPGHSTVSSPFMSLDGDYPEVHILETGTGSLVLTDYGETFRSLANSSIDSEAETRADLLRRIKSLLSVREERGRLVIEVAPSDLGDGLHRMFQAMAFVEDMIFTANPRDQAEFKDRVFDVLSPVAASARGKLRRNQTLIGNSTRTYTADFHLHVIKDVWIEVITASTAGSFRNQVNHAHAMWSDVLDSVRRITLLDNTVQYMDEGSDRFLRGVSNVALWSDQEAFADLVVSMTS